VVLDAIGYVATIRWEIVESHAVQSPSSQIRPSGTSDGYQRWFVDIAQKGSSYPNLSKTSPSLRRARASVSSLSPYSQSLNGGSVEREGIHDGSPTSGPERPEHVRKHGTSSLHMISQPRGTHHLQRPLYLNRGSWVRSRRRRRRGWREYTAVEDKAGDDTTDMYVDKDEGDSARGVGGKGGAARCDASAVPSRVARAYPAGDHNRVVPAYSASMPPCVPAPFPPTISISSRPHLSPSARAARSSVRRARARVRRCAMGWCAGVEKTIERSASTLRRILRMAPGCDRLVLMKSAAARQCLARGRADRLGRGCRCPGRHSYSSQLLSMVQKVRAHRFNIHDFACRGRNRESSCRLT
jgi:hypothetical protein